MRILERLSADGQQQRRAAHQVVNGCHRCDAELGANRVDPWQHRPVEKVPHDRAERGVAEVAENPRQRPHPWAERRHSARPQVGGERREHQPGDRAGVGGRHRTPAGCVDDDRVGPHRVDGALQVVHFQGRAPAHHVDRQLQHLQRALGPPILPDDLLDFRGDGFGAQAGRAEHRDAGGHGAHVHVVTASGELAQQCTDRQHVTEPRRAVGQDDRHGARIMRQGSVRHHADL